MDDVIERRRVNALSKHGRTLIDAGRCRAAGKCGVARELIGALSKLRARKSVDHDSSLVAGIRLDSTPHHFQDDLTLLCLRTSPSLRH